SSSVPGRLPTNTRGDPKCFLKYLRRVVDKVKKLTRPRIFEMKFEGANNMKTNNRLARVTTLALLVATLTINTASRTAAAATAAQDTAPTTNIEFGGIKLGKTQNALIIVVCAVDQTGRDQRPVDVEFMFYDWDGNLVAGKTETIMPGHASSFD